jgi:hypothetical protein
MEWSQAVKEAAVAIPKDLKYKWDSSARGGVTKDLYWGDKRILAASSPPKLFCCGFTMEIVLTALKRFPGPVKNLSVDDVREMKRFAFLQPESMQQLYWGLPGLMVDRGYADLITEPSLVRTGDLAQMWFDWPATLVDDDPSVPGHSVVVYDKPGTESPFEIVSGKESIWSVGANSRPGNGGVVRDWFWWKKNDRRWLVARPKKEWLES